MKPSWVHVFIEDKFKTTLYIVSPVYALEIAVIDM